MTLLASIQSHLVKVHDPMKGQTDVISLVEMFEKKLLAFKVTANDGPKSFINQVTYSFGKLVVWSKVASVRVLANN